MRMRGQRKDYNDELLCPILGTEEKENSKKIKMFEVLVGPRREVLEGYLGK